MSRALLKAALAASVLTFCSFGAVAMYLPLSPALVGAKPAAIPTAMCGYSCRTGGRYIPGPPSVCAEEGLNYCGPSRRREIEEDDDDSPPRRSPGGYYGGGPAYGGAPRASLCVTARGNCATRPAPPNTPCGCDIPGFGYKRGAVAP